MLKDPRASAFVTASPVNGLFAKPANCRATNLFFDFDDNLREGFQRETELFVQDQLQADHSVLDLLTADYTFLNERLARHYGISNVCGHFRVASGRPSGGIAGTRQHPDRHLVSEPYSPVKRDSGC